jgi:hypothetical protein
LHVEDGRIANVRKTAQMLVVKGLVHGVIQVSVVDLVQLHAERHPGELVELLGQIVALLMGALGGGGEGGELAVDLAEELVELAEVQRARLVSVVLLEQPVQSLEMVRGLREALLDPFGDGAPLSIVHVQRFRVAALFPGKRAQEGHDVGRDFVLDGCTVTDCVDVTERRAQDTAVGIGLEGVFVGLLWELLGDFSREISLGWLMLAVCKGIGAWLKTTYKRLWTRDKSPLVSLSFLWYRWDPFEKKPRDLP